MPTTVNQCCTECGVTVGYAEIEDPPAGWDTPQDLDLSAPQEAVGVRVISDTFQKNGGINVTFERTVIIEKASAHGHYFWQLCKDCFAKVLGVLPKLSKRYASDAEFLRNAYGKKPDA